MKNASTIFIHLFFFISTLSAQITVNSDDMYDYIGATYLFATDTLPDASIQVGSFGSSTWDFSALQQHESFSWTIDHPDGTPFESEFPDATFIVNEADAAWVYYEKTADALNLLGVGAQDSSFSFILPYEPKQKIIQFPVSYNSAFSDVSTQVLQLSGDAFGLPVDSIRTATTINRGVVVDAFGTMQVPGGSVEALRIETRSVSFDSIFIKVLGAWSLFEGDMDGDTSLQYTWVTNETGWDLPIVSIEGEIDSTGAFVALNAGWLVEPVISSTKKVQPTSFDLFPNPTTDVLNIKFEEPQRGTLDVIDFNGENILQQPFDGASTSINLGSAQTGNYVVVFKNKEGKIAGFKQFKVIR